MIDTGAALPLRDSDVATIAGYLGCHIAAVRAVLAVEARGEGFGPEGRPIILNEPHVFYRELGKGPKRDRAVKEGLAYRYWGAKPYPKTQAERYAWLEKAVKIDETAALKSCSYGMGQVMGFNYKAAGFPSVQDFVQAMTLSEGAHLYAMARFIVSNGLQKHLRALNWAGFARGYNGSGYKKNEYDTKLARAYLRRPASEKVTPEPAKADELLALISHPLPIDLPDETDVEAPTAGSGAPKKAGKGVGVGTVIAVGAGGAAVAFWDWISEFLSALWRGLGLP